MRTIISNYVGVVAWVVTLDGLKGIDAGDRRSEVSCSCVVFVCGVWCGASQKFMLNELFVVGMYE